MISQKFVTYWTAVDKLLDKELVIFLDSLRKFMKGADENLDDDSLRTPPPF